ncbi:hypothetical protein EJ05DRAFT_509301 [Pseudovirgaria hyperparasitica]|uniref:Uncharacterized protein n=1 Tax=Pseudovirgaria hyperparasitica TaxID=470096 RepID=A0A6A6WA66_9PEZI|nr:uncharacterized protein EJ05DRAFT_509301 [Pseudovirgaria hyperparasitica]KAF2759563.1 hypothetical protein EJ05DRAFT_509301 [Pseudovirgaria hyperparasitica]
MKPYRPPGRSRAAPSTLCQKCLKRGHFSYECSAKAQERPYAARPSRTQQLFNPTLVPELTNDVPADLLPKKGVADEQLAKKELERTRKRSRDERERRHRRKRSRSMSSRASSVSTISTNRSRSPSPEHTSKRKRLSGTMPNVHLGRDEQMGGKRRRSPSILSSDSQVSRVSDGMKESVTQGPAQKEGDDPRRYGAYTQQKSDTAKEKITLALNTTRSASTEKPVVTVSVTQSRLREWQSRW